MTRSLLALIVVLASLLVFGCVEEGEPTPCEQASDKIEACFGQPLGECTDQLAEVINGSDCDALSADASIDAKADGSFFCPSWLWWLCGDDISVECDAAGSLRQYANYDAAGKLDYHWQWVQCTEYGRGDVPGLKTDTWDLLLNSASGVFTSGLSMDRAFTNSTDELDQGRVKLLHPYGTVAKVQLVRDEADKDCEASYTGVFAEDKIPALARLGWGAEPEGAGYIPGVGLKVFIEGSDSVNLHVIHSLEGNPDEPNFFGQTLGNVLDMPGGVVGALVRLMGLVVDEPLHLRLDHLARTYTSGEMVSAEDQVVPYAITFVATAEAYDAYDVDADFREAFAKYEAGSTLYHVYLQAKPDACWGRWGSMETTSSFVASEWGDRKLYFKHATEGQGL
jgi:hypothetical protein